MFGEASPVDAGLDSLQLIAGLAPGKTWYFALSAVDRCGNISEYSQELSITTMINHRPVFYHKVIHIDPDLKNGTIIDTLMAVDEDPDQTLSFYFTDNNSEEAFALDPVTGILRVQKEERLNYFQTRTDTLLLFVGVNDDAPLPYHDQGLVMVILDVETWVPEYPEKPSSSLELYPNPARSQVTVKLGELGWSEKISLMIFSSDGKCHLSAIYNQLNHFETELEVSTLERGVYYVVLKTDEEKRTGKLVIF